MFKLDQMRALGTWEESVGNIGAQEAQETYGPEKPTAVETVVQAATDMTGLQKNIVYAIGAGVVAYVAYQYFYGE